MNSTKELSLWQLTNEHQTLLAQLYNYETGEINDIVQAKIDALYPDIEKKCIAVSKWIRHIESEKKQLESMLVELESRKISYEKEINKYSNYLQSNMEKQNIKEISCPLFTIKLKKNPYSTEILNEYDIPSKFIKIKEVVRIESKPDKTAIKEEVLKTGIQIPGAHVCQKNKLEIVVDKV